MTLARQTAPGLEVLSKLEDEENELKARAILNRATVELSADRYYDALHILTGAAPLFLTSNNHAIRGKCHGSVGVILESLSEGENREDCIDCALIKYAAASFHFEQAGHTHFRALVENNLGFLLFSLGRYDEAHSHLDRARKLFLSLKDGGSIAQVDRTRASVLIAQQRYSEAERTARASVRALEKGGQQSLLADALTTHGMALARLRRYGEARSMLHRAVEVAHNAGALNVAGLAALTIIEELSQRLSVDELRSVYALADDLLADSQHPQTLHRLRQAVRRILAVVRAREGVVQDSEARAPRFVYASEQIAALLRDAHRIATTPSPVLITGETGTGKELLGRLIHEWSGRAGQFVAVNCATLMETLVVSQIFGHRKGSFTDAVEDQPGAAHKAAGGTLFLDEIGELSTSNQAKLLRLIEHGEVQPIGASTPERVDVRIIAATNSDLKEDVERELFREDLYYRLQAFHLYIQPLRERREDIPVLAEQFIEESFSRYGERVTFTSEAIEAMRQLPLRGNARKLRSLIERTVLMAPQDAAIIPATVKAFELQETETGDLLDSWAGCVLSDEVRRYEGRLIKMALEASQGHITRAAKLLGTTHQGLAFILQGRHKDLLSARTPIRRRRRSIIGKEKHKQS